MGTGVLFIHGGAFVELNVLAWGWVLGRGVVGGTWNEPGLLVLARLQFLFWVCAVRGGPQMLLMPFVQFTASMVAAMSWFQV